MGRGAGGVSGGQTWLYLQLVPRDHSVAEVPLDPDSPVWTQGLNLLWKMGWLTMAPASVLSEDTGHTVTMPGTVLGIEGSPHWAVLLKCSHLETENEVFGSLSCSGSSFQVSQGG